MSIRVRSLPIASFELTIEFDIYVIAIERVGPAGIAWIDDEIARQLPLASGLFNMHFFFFFLYLK